MTDDKSRNRRRISIDEAGLDRRRSAIQALMEQTPSPASEQAGVFAEANAPGAPQADLG
ncbi:hypothetical protein ACFFV7_00675 [Nonomuraea spiralis]|uniref:Uncharacterized protein n=1 Tax=Nonomuraea spiralis TaxID=46182 RepID=A0ABV5I581_9ACTN|nr:MULTISPECIES: hypothetical protein [Nonomuraea]GGS62931.1 hypothetical protein GCM10010176_001340 [Nonomuraea spiralis]